MIFSRYGSHSALRYLLHSDAFNWSCMELLTARLTSISDCRIERVNLAFRGVCFASV